MSLAHRLAAMHCPRMLEKWASRARARPRVAVLMYHEVLPDQHDFPSWLVVRRSDFERQMQHVSSYYAVVPLDAIASGGVQTGGKPAVAITFDDGYAGNLLYAAPVLRELRLPYSVYVATSRVAEGGRYWYDDVICALVDAASPIEIRTSTGTLRFDPRPHSADLVRWTSINAILTALKELGAEERQSIATALASRGRMSALRMMTPDEVRELSGDSLCTIGNHTDGHELLDQLPRDAAARSIAKAQNLLAEWTGASPRHFAYPNGSYAPEHCQLVSDLGFATAVTTNSGLWDGRDSLYEIPRVGVGRFDNLNLFRAKLSGLVG